MKFKKGDIVYCLDNSDLQGGRSLDRGKPYLIHNIVARCMCMLKGKGGAVYIDIRFNYENQKHLF